MSLYVSIVIIVGLMAVSISMYKDIMSPSFLMLVPWLISFSLLIDSNLYYKDSTIGYLYIVCGIIFFQLFYAATFYSTSKNIIVKKNSYYQEKYKTRKINKLVFFAVLIFEIITMSYYLLLLLKGSAPLSIFEYIHKMVFAVFYILVLHYCTCANDEKKTARNCLLLQIIPLAITLMLSTNGRASYFVFILGALFIYLTYHGYNTFAILKYFLIVLLIFLALFIYVAIRKNHIAEGTAGHDLIVETRNWLTHYFSGSLITFSEWLPNWKMDYSFGKNTFRIIYAVLDRFGWNVNVSTTFFPFMKIGPEYNNIANVYTIFYTYIIDFGYFGGIIVEAILGVAYAKLYIKKDFGKIGNVYLYAILMYALLMQCFGDQYVAITSYYLQMYLWYFIFYKCQLLFFRRDKGLVLVRY